MHELKVTTADFIKNFGQLSDKALTEPLTITKNGRDRLVVISVDEYERLKARDRRVLLAEDVSDEMLAALARTDDIPPEAIALNSESKDWGL